MSKPLTRKRLDEIKNTLFPDNVQPLANELILEVEYLAKRIAFLRKEMFDVATDITKALEGVSVVQANLLKLIEKIFE